MFSTLSRRSSQSLYSVVKSLSASQVSAVRAFSTTQIARNSKAAAVEEEEETLEQRVRRQIQEEEGVDFVTKFPKKFVKAGSAFPDMDSEIEEHIKIQKELTFWPYLHAIIIAIVVVCI